MSADLLLQGFIAALTWSNLIAAATGVLLGTLAGVLPGLGIAGTVAVLLPFSYSMEALTALILISGVFFGSQYGGSTTSILVNIPGEATSVVTAIDGHAMARRGKAGTALGISAIGSFVAGTIGIIGLSYFAPTVAKAALAFGPPEYCTVALFGLIVLTTVFGVSVLRSMLMVVIGMMIGSVGLDPVLGTSRFGFGFASLEKGFDFVVLIMALFGLPEVLSEITSRAAPAETHRFRFWDLYPSREEIKQSAAPILRGSLLGFLVGLLPGPSAVISTFASYALEKRVSRHPEQFGHGAIAGVAGPESANNCAIYAQMVPLVSLGIPFSSSMALLLSAFVMHGITPGPMLVSTNPDIFWGLIASLYIGNVMLLILNLPLVGVFASVLRVPFNYLFPIVTLVMITGAFSVNNSMFDLYMLITFGLIGYVLRLCRFDLTALILGAFLGPMMESSFLQSLQMSDGNLSVFLTRPISGTILALTMVVMASRAVRTFLRRKPLPGTGASCD